MALGSHIDLAMIGGHGKSIKMKPHGQSGTRFFDKNLDASDKEL